MQGGWQPPPGGGSGYGGPPGYGPPQGPPGYGAPPPGQYGDYEFNALENAIIDKTAARAKTWGWISTVLGICQLLGGSCGAIWSAGMAVYVPYGLVMTIAGITFIGVGNSLRSVVLTRGNDVAHMMQALQKLGSAFVVQTISYLVLLVVVLGLGFVMFFFVFAAAATGSR